MNDVETFLDLPIAAQVATICLVACATGLFTEILAAPRRNCFFFQWHPEVRLLVLLVSPVLLIVWPAVLFNYFVKSRGVNLDDLDFYDD
jgi:hypothetical protein